MVVYRALFFRYITDISFIFLTPKSTRYRSSPAISRSDDKSFQRYILPAIYRLNDISQSVQNIITIYRFSEISFQRFIAESGMFIAIYRSGNVSPQRVFSWREMLVFYISFKRNNYMFFQIPPPLCFGLCKLLMLFKCVCKGNIQ